MIGRFHAQAIRDMSGGSLHSILDRNQERAEELAEEFGAKAYSDIDAFLADPELEIVTVGTPSGAHLDPTLAALQAGKHAIVEKPLEVTTERIDQLIDAASANGKTLASILAPPPSPVPQPPGNPAPERKFLAIIGLRPETLQGSPNKSR